MRFDLILAAFAAALVSSPAAAAPYQLSAPQGQISGVVVELETGAPVPRARVVITPDGRSPLQALTDQSGRYTFDNLQPGSYQLAADKIGYVKPEGRPGGVARLGVGQSITAPPILLQKTGVITGRVLDPSGEPMQDVRVRAVRREVSNRAAPDGPNSSRVAELLRQDGRTNDLGEFRLFGLTPGDYVVVASPQPFGMSTATMSTALARETFYPGAPDAVSAQTLSVSSGQTVVIEFPLLAVPTFTVSGVVIDEAGAPVAGATVIVALDAQPHGPTVDPNREIDGLLARAYGAVVQRGATVRTDSAGRFTIRNLASDAYYATAAGSSQPFGAASGVQAVNGAAASRTSRSDPVQVIVDGADIEGVTIVLRDAQ